METRSAATTADEGHRAELTVDQWAAAVVAEHKGNPLAAIKTLLEDNAHLRHELAVTSVAMSRGFTRGWGPKFDRV